MKVYIIIHHTDIWSDVEGQEIMSIHASYEGAYKRKEELKKSDLWQSKLTIKEHEVLE